MLLISLCFIDNEPAEGNYYWNGAQFIKFYSEWHVDIQTYMSEEFMSKFVLKKIFLKLRAVILNN